LQLLVLNWVIRPLRKVSKELHEVEAGEREELSADYPPEILQLSSHLNNLLKTNGSRLQRYRNSLSDLAHSLKTPLASARLSIESKKNNDSDVLEQLDHINTTINYQLQRASTSGPSSLTTSVEIEPAVKRVTKSLLKVFHDKGLQIDIDIAPDCQFKGDAGDLIEILGNLCENACKWAHTTIRISARQIETAGTASVHLKIEDDGPGIPVTARKEVFTRGMRADSRQPGQGIGLATVHEMVVEVYDGAIEITDSDLGGAAISIHI
jgi:two-component system sensor histidine kinase PhoQ